MTERIIIAGAGGQGIMLLGKVLALSAMRVDKFVTWLPSYGAEVRGGAAYCMVTISDEEIGSPYIEEADTLIAMNQPSLDKFKGVLKNKGLLVVNSSLAEIKISESKYLLKQPFSDIAVELGNIRIANMVALGSYIKRSDIIKLKIVLSTIEGLTPQDRKDLGEINKKALLAGARTTGDKS